MNAEFYETDQIEDAMIDLFIDQLHQFAELEDEESDRDYRLGQWLSG